MIPRQKELTNKMERDGQLISVLVREPNYRHIQDGQKIYNRAFKDGLESGALLREKLPHYLREQKLWDDEKQKEYDDLTKALREGEQKLKKGKVKLSEGRKIALGMINARSGLRNLLAQQMSLDNATVQAQAENQRFNYYVSVCTVYEDTGNVIFKNLEDYLSRAREPVAFEAASLLAGLIHNYDEEHEKKLPENSFLIKYKFVDSKLRFINKDGQLVDAEDRLVDEDGRYIKIVDGKKVYVNRNGDVVDFIGDLVIEDAGEFIDDVYDKVELPVVEKELACDS